MSRADAIEALAVLTAAYNKNIPEETLRIYVKCLEDLERDALLAAASDWIILSQWFPTVAELRRKAVVASNGGSLPPSPYEAWGEVVAAASRQGRQWIPTWSNPAIGAALDQIGGYRRVCDSELPGVERSHFLKSYEAIVDKIRDQVHIPAALQTSLRMLEIGGGHVPHQDDTTGDVGSV